MHFSYQSLWDEAKAEKVRVTTRVIVPHPEDPTQILMLQRSKVDGQSFPDYWEMPGGSIEPTETPEAAAQRETKEEAGIIVQKVVYLPTTSPYFFSARKKEKLIQLYFISTQWAGEVKTFTAVDEHKAFQWLNVMAWHENLLNVVPSRIPGIEAYAQHISQNEAKRNK